MLHRPAGAMTDLVRNESRPTGSGPGSEWLELRDILRNRSYSASTNKVLSSGRTSSFYFDVKRTLSEPRGAELIAKLVYERLRSLPVQVEMIGGLAMGAVPIANYVTLHSQHKGDPIPNFWVRQKPKEHGTRAVIEGHSSEELKNKSVMIVDDVTTSGDSVLKAVEATLTNGANVVSVLTIVDRLEGAADNIAQKGLELIALFTADDFRSQ